MLWACAALALQHQPLVPEALPATSPTETKPNTKPPLVTLAEINKIYEHGRPSNHVSGPNAAGLVIHMHDLTEKSGFGQMFVPGDSAQWLGPNGFWATSIINRKMPGLYMPPTGRGPCDGTGIIVNPRTARVLCSSAWDFTSWTSGCTGVGGASSKLYPPDKLEDMLNVSAELESRPNVNTFGGKYNEVIIASQDYRDQLPESVAAVFYTGDDAGCAVQTHRTVVGAFGIDPGQVLLLNHTPGGSPGFAEHVPAKGEELPEDAICPKPPTWCVHATAKSEAKECGGLPGHFCQDVFGKSGFSPCDETVNATWGTVECVATNTSSDENAKRSERRKAPVYWWAAGAKSRDDAATAEPKSVDSSGLTRLSLTQQRHQHRWSHLLELLVGSPSSSQLVWNSSLPKPSNGNGSTTVRTLWKNLTSLFSNGGSPVSSRDKRAAAVFSMYDGISM